MERNDELEISLTDLFFWVLRYWYIILIALIIGCSMGGAYAYYVNQTLAAKTVDMQIAEVKNHLTPLEIKDVDEIYEKEKQAKEKRDAYYLDMNNSNYSGDDLADAVKLVEYWTGIYNQQHNMGSYLIDYQKDYYELLTADPDKEPDYLSIPKYAIIGGMILLFCVVLYFSAVYIFTPTIKTPNDLSLMFNYPILMNLRNDNAKEDILAVDISILMENKSLSNLAILCDSSLQFEKDAASRLVEHIDQVTNNITTVVIDPLSSTEDLKKLSVCDSVISLVSLKKTRRPHLLDLFSYCKRYGCNVLGFITLDQKAK